MIRFLFIIILWMAPFISLAQKKAAVVYYSNTGNTETVAKKIASTYGADIFKLEPQNAYPEQYEMLLDYAKKEIEGNVRPELKNNFDISGYELIFVGSPCWWSTIAPVVNTFLTSQDFSGKIIAPFITHQGSRMGNAIEHIEEMCPNVNVTEGLPIHASSIGECDAAIKRWLERISEEL